jgi:guanine nucleotide-binding protein subunit alpha
MGGGQAKSVEVKGGSSDAAASSGGGKKGDEASKTILLLGTAGVGKTTIVKQLTMSWGSGLSDAKRLELRDALRRNCIKRLIDIVNYAADDQHEALTAEPEDYLFEKVEQLGMTDISKASPEEIAAIGEDLVKMWQSPAVVEIAKRKITNVNDIQLAYDSADKFLSKENGADTKRVFAADYAITNQDVLLVRDPTKDIETTKFDYNKEAWYVKDVGGQIHHRHTWQTAFDGVSVVMYIVSLADYDHFEGKDLSKNVLMESRKLFKDVCADPRIMGKPFVLLFNKADLFTAKLKNKPFSVCPEFEKTDNQRPNESDQDYAQRCMKYLFMYYERAYATVLREQMNVEEAPIEYYETCATDMDFIDNTMNAVFSSLLKRLVGITKSMGL